MDSRPAVPQDGWNSPRGSRVGHCDDRIHPRTDNRGLRAHGNAAENAENCAETAQKSRNSFIRGDAQRDAAHCPARLCFADILKEVPKLIDESAESAEFAAENAEKIAENAENAENSAENAENFAETQKISQEAHNTH